MELNTQDQIKAHLISTSEEFRKMVEDHSSYDRKLQELEALDHLSMEQEAEEHRLKKLKLLLKDHMTEMLSRSDLQAV